LQGLFAQEIQPTFKWVFKISPQHLVQNILKVGERFLINPKPEVINSFFRLYLTIKTINIVSGFFLIMVLGVK